MANHDDLGPWGLNLRQVEREDSIREQLDEAESRRLQNYETAVARYVSQLLAPITLDDCDADEVSAVTATCEDIARERISGRTDGYASKLFGGRPCRSIEQFRAELQSLQERIIRVEAERDGFRGSDDYRTGAKLADELAREALTRLSGQGGWRASLFELLERLSHAERDLESAKTESLARRRTPFLGGVPTGGGLTAPMSYDIRGAGYAGRDTRQPDAAPSRSGPEESAPRQNSGRAWEQLHPAPGDGDDHALRPSADPEVASQVSSAAAPDSGGAEAFGDDPARGAAGGRIYEPAHKGRFKRQPQFLHEVGWLLSKLAPTPESESLASVSDWSDRYTEIQHVSLSALKRATKRWYGGSWPTAREAAAVHYASCNQGPSCVPPDGPPDVRK